MFSAITRVLGPAPVSVRVPEAMSVWHLAFIAQETNGLSLGKKRLLRKHHLKTRAWRNTPLIIFTSLLRVDTYQGKNDFALA